MRTRSDLRNFATLPRGALQSCTEARMIPCAWQLHHAHAQQAAARLYMYV